MVKNKLKEANEKLGIGDSDSLRDKQLIFVYCSPKVGSTSLVSSLRIALNNKYTILHIHNENMLRSLYNITDISVMDIIHYNKNIGKKVYVFDIYRSVMEQRISLFFENIDTFHFNNSIENLNTYNIDLFIKRFNLICPHFVIKDHFKETYNIEYPDVFDYKNKYLKIIKDDITFIKLRLKDSNEWGFILSYILNEPIYIISDYKTSDKPIKELYSNFKTTYKIPQNIIYELEECDTLKYYYSNEERSQYLASWQNKCDGQDFKSFTPEEYKIYVDISRDNKYKSDVHYEHYFDNGCICNGCNYQRGLVYMKLKMGKKYIGRIDHKLSISLKNKSHDKKNVQHRQPPVKSFRMKIV